MKPRKRQMIKFADGKIFVEEISAIKFMWDCAVIVEDDGRSLFAFELEEFQPQWNRAHAEFAKSAFQGRSKLIRTEEVMP